MHYYTAACIFVSIGVMLVLRWSDATNNFGKLSLECRCDTPMIRMAVVTFSALEVFVSGGFISALWMTLKFHVVTFMAVLFAAKYIVLRQGTANLKCLFKSPTGSSCVVTVVPPRLHC